ncbi:hypothetical protein AB0N09_05585 [Streptomyces erythrochromogenes]|uniref:hypothetical protein n=1 Tax=Streptomyces erythrochromogenes TaxID=285574 RepID=UPI003425443D
MPLRRYRCDTCQVTYSWVKTDREIDNQRNSHRLRAHYGGRPDGEDIQETYGLSDYVSFAVIAAIVILVWWITH